MKKLLIILLLFLVPVVHAEPMATSYWGYVTVDGITKANALVTVLDPSGKELGSSKSTSNATYEVRIPWDDTTTQVREGAVDGETLTFYVDGKSAASRIIDAKGTNNRLDLTLSGSSKASASSSGPSGGSNVPAPADTIIKNESVGVSPSKDIPETTPVATRTGEIPGTTAPPGANKAPGFSIVLGSGALILLILRKRY